MRTLVFFVLISTHHLSSSVAVAEEIGSHPSRAEVGSGGLARAAAKIARRAFTVDVGPERARALAKALRAILGERLRIEAQSVTTAGERGARRYRLELASSRPTFERLRELLGRPCATAPKVERRIRVYALKEASAPNVAAVLTRLATSAFRDEMKIVADGATNSLLVVSSPKDFEALKSVIEKIDAPTRVPPSLRRRDN